MLLSLFTARSFSCFCLFESIPVFTLSLSYADTSSVEVTTAANKGFLLQHVVHGLWGCSGRQRIRRLGYILFLVICQRLRWVQTHYITTGDDMLILIDLMMSLLMVRRRCWWENFFVHTLPMRGFLITVVILNFKMHLIICNYKWLLIVYFYDFFVFVWYTFKIFILPISRVITRIIVDFFELLLILLFKISLVSSEIFNWQLCILKFKVLLVCLCLFFCRWSHNLPVFCHRKKD